MTDRQSEAVEFFKSKGWSPVQAAAIVGHGIAESGLDPARHQGGGNAYGGWQWDDRKPKLLSWLGANGYKQDDFKGQMEYVQHELDSSESYAADQLRSATTPESATAAFMHFERPQGYSRGNPTAGHNWAGRLAATKAVYDGSASYPSLGGGAVSGNAVTASPSPAKVNWSDPVEPKSPVNDVEMNAFRAQQADTAKPYGFGEGLWEATKDAQTMTWLSKGATHLLPDPDWVPTKETLTAAQSGIPKQYQDQLGAATSQGHLEQIRSQTAAIEGLNALRPGAIVTVLTNSEYVAKGMNEWLPGWKAKGWRGSNKKPLLNADLWGKLDAAAGRHEGVRWVVGQRC